MAYNARRDPLASSQTSISSLASVADEEDASPLSPHAGYMDDGPFVWDPKPIPIKPLLLRAEQSSRSVLQMNASTASLDGSDVSPDALLDYVLAMRQPLPRSQSETTASNPSRENGLYKNRPKHDRQLSTDSAGSANSDDGEKSIDKLIRAQGSTGLEEVNLSHKGIPDLPIEVCNVLAGTVEKLALGYNRLQSLPRQFAGLGSRLRYLNVRVNSFSVFPAVLCDLPSLEILDISRNKIQKFPTHPGTLVKLRVLVIHKNRIRRLPQYLSQMTHLRMLKIDHNPIEWPPRDIVTYPSSTTLGTSPLAVAMGRSQSDRSNVTTSSADSSMRPDDPQIMAKWLGALQKYIKEHPEQKQEDDRTTGTDHGKKVHATSTLEEASSSKQMGPLPTEASINSTIRPDQPISHYRKGSAVPLSHLRSQSSGLRSKKSLPDLRLTTIPPSPALVLPTPLNTSSSQENGTLLRLHQASPIIKQGMEHGREGKPMDRNSGAYFRRLSMLPANNAMPLYLLEFIEAVRGILFSLSQIYTALQQFVQFATQDRLPVAITKMMASADTSMGFLIGALDRFDSVSRRRGNNAELSALKEVVDACRENVSIFSKLVGVLKIQLKVLTSQADTRYIRTLQLMLYGSLGEISIAWKDMVPHALSIAQLLAQNTSPDTSVTLHPPTPSPKLDSQPMLSDAKPAAGPSSYRRHAGSFSVEDVQAGAGLPPASPASDEPSTPLPPIPASTAVLALRPPKASRRNLSPGSLQINGSGNQVPFMDLMATLEGQPPTPGLFHGSHLHTSASQPAIAPPHSLKPPIVETPRGNNLVLPPPIPKRNNSFAHLPAAGARAVDNDYLDLADATTNVAFSVCNMLLENLSESASQSKQGSRRAAGSNDLVELCDVASDWANKLKASLEHLRREWDTRNQRQVVDDSNAFAKAVISLMKNAKEASQEQPFPKLIREGMSQLAKSTHSLLAMLTVTSFRGA